MAGAGAAARTRLRRVLGDGDKLGEESGRRPLMVNPRGTFVRVLRPGQWNKASPGR